MDTTLGERIRIRREELSLRPVDLAEAVGVSISAVLYWESGQTKNLKNEHLFALADRLQVNPRWLGIGEGPKRLPVAMRVAAKAAMILAVLLLIPPTPSQAVVLSDITSGVYYVKSRRWWLLPRFRIS